MEGLVESKSGVVVWRFNDILTLISPYIFPCHVIPGIVRPLIPFLLGKS